MTHTHALKSNALKSKNQALHLYLIVSKMEPLATEITFTVLSSDSDAGVRLADSNSGSVSTGRTIGQNPLTGCTAMVQNNNFSCR